MNFPRDDDDDVVYYDPSVQIWLGLWILFIGASVFLGLRLWCKIMRRHGLWYDDYVLIFAYVSCRMMRCCHAVCLPVTHLRR